MHKRNRPTPYLTLDNVNRPATASITRAHALRSLGEVVYAVRTGDVVKIGHTTNLQTRISAIRHETGYDPEVLAFMPGTYDDEQAIHAALDGHQHHGDEWYYPTRAVLEVVNVMRETLGLEPVAA